MQIFPHRPGFGQLFVRCGYSGDCNTIMTGLLSKDLSFDKGVQGLYSDFGLVGRFADCSLAAGRLVVFDLAQPAVVVDSQIISLLTSRGQGKKDLPNGTHPVELVDQTVKRPPKPR